MGRFERDFENVEYREPKATDEKPKGSPTPWPHFSHNNRQRVQCHATNRRGKRCRQWAMKGQRVCRLHGGSAPQSLDAARRRLQAAMDPVMARLIDIALDPGLEPRDALVAIRDVLDRGGLSAKQSHELTIKPWEQALQDIVAAAGGEVVIAGDVLEGELVADEGYDDDAESGDSASTRDSEHRRQPAVDYLGTDRPQGTVDPHQEANRAQLARQRRRRR